MKKVLALVFTIYILSYTLFEGRSNYGAQPNQYSIETIFYFSFFNVSLKRGVENEVISLLQLLRNGIKLLNETDPGAQALSSQSRVHNILYYTTWWEDHKGIVYKIVLNH